MTCPDCERHKASASRWRNEAYRLNGTPLPWSPDEELLRQALQEFESFTHGSGGLYEGEFKEIISALRERLKENP